MSARRIAAVVFACLTVCSTAVAFQPIDVVVKPDYSTKLAGRLSDSLYKLIDNNSLFSLVPSSSGFHLEFVVSDVVLLDSEEPQLVSLKVRSTLYEKKYRGVESESLLIDHSKAVCNKQLFMVCEHGIEARLNYALDVALKKTSR